MPQGYLESIQQASTAAKQALERVVGPVLGILAQSEIESVLAASASAEAIELETAIREAQEHAANVAGLLVKGVGELAAYTSTLGGTPALGDTIAKPVWSAKHISRPGLITPEQPSLTLDFSLEELQEVIKQLPTLKKVHHGTTDIYKIPGHPDKLLRAGTIAMYTRNKTYGPEQNRGHMHRYQTELELLHAAGIPILPHVSYIAENTIRSRSMLYTVTTRHPRPTQLHKFSRVISDIERERMSLDTVEKLITYYTNPDREAADPTAVPIWDLSIDQFANDGTLLDMDPFLCVNPKDLENVLSELSWWRKSVPVTTANHAQHIRLQQRIGKAYQEAKARRLATRAPVRLPSPTSTA